MACMLRISGVDFDVDDYLSKTNWGSLALKVYHKGEKSPLRSMGIHTDSGFAICVSDGEFDDFYQQEKDVVAFIEKYKHNLELLASYNVNRWCAFDFGLSTYPENGFYKEYQISAELCKGIGDLGMQLVMSNYFTRNDDYLRRRARKHKKAWPIKKSN